jgi:hypothetical protein
LLYPRSFRKLDLWSSISMFPLSFPFLGCCCHCLLVVKNFTHID